MSEPPPSLRLLRVGLPLVGFGVCLLWTLFAWSVLGLLVYRETPAEFIQEWPGTVVAILWPTFLVMQLIGMLLCLGGAPKAWQIRGSEAPAIAVTVLQLLVYLALFPHRWLPWPAATLWVLLLLGPALHLYFLTNFAPRIDQEPLGKRAEQGMFALLILIVFPVLYLAGAISFGTVLRDFVLILLFLVLGLALLSLVAMLILYINLHLALYHAIPLYLEGFAEQQKLREAGWVDQPPL